MILYSQSSRLTSRFFFFTVGSCRTLPFPRDHKCLGVSAAQAHVKVKPFSRFVPKKEMTGNSLAQVSACPTVLSLSRVFSNSLPYLPSRSTKLTRIRATSANTAHSQPPSSKREKNILAVVLDAPRPIWRQTLRPLSDFGFGSRSIWEGGVGLFLVSGAVLALSLAWLRGYHLRSRFRNYLAVFEFTQAWEIATGTPVQI